MRVECARKKNVRGSVLVKLRLVGPTEDGVRACRQIAVWIEGGHITRSVSWVGGMRDYLYQNFICFILTETNLTV